MTAHGKEETEKAALEKGAWAYVEKPYIIDRIKDMLKEVSKKPPGHHLS
jgi:DNA-binding NtrC family response regulator